MFLVLSKAHRDNHKLGPEKDLAAQVDVATTLGIVCNLLTDVVLNENCHKLADEMDLSFSVDNRQKVILFGTDSIKYANVGTGGECFTIIIRNEGEGESRIAPPILVFQNEDRSSLIRNLPDYVYRVTYSRGLEEYIHCTVMSNFLSQTRVIRV